ncbi:MAG: DUF6252 family protein [Bergeyella sp.]
MKTKYIFFITLLSLCILSCRDKDQDPDVLPNATQHGANTGGALVDGKVWVAKIEQPDLNPGGNNTQYEFVNGEYKLQIHLRNIENPSGNVIKIYLVSDQDFDTGNYQLNEINTAIYSPSTYPYYTNSNNVGVINITKFDKVNKIISGTFSFKAINMFSNEVVTITEGRFDKKFL